MDGEGWMGWMGWDAMGWAGGWMDGRKDGWMDGWMEQRYLPTLNTFGALVLGFDCCEFA